MLQQLGHQLQGPASRRVRLRLVSRRRQRQAQRLRQCPCAPVLLGWRAWPSPALALVPAQPPAPLLALLTVPALRPPLSWALQQQPLQQGECHGHVEPAGAPRRRLWAAEVDSAVRHRPSVGQWHARYCARIGKSTCLWGALQRVLLRPGCSGALPRRQFPAPGLASLCALPLLASAQEAADCSPVQDTKPFHAFAGWLSGWKRRQKSAGAGRGGGMHQSTTVMESIEWPSV